MSVQASNQRTLSWELLIRIVRGVCVDSVTSAVETVVQSLSVRVGSGAVGGGMWILQWSHNLYITNNQPLQLYHVDIPKYRHPCSPGGAGDCSTVPVRAEEPPQ